MSTHGITVDGQEKRRGVRCLEPSTFERFRDARHLIEQRNDREITNDEVLSLLLDVWWYHERQNARGAT